MKPLSKEQYIAIVVVLLVAAFLLFGFNLGFVGSSNVSVNQEIKMDQLKKEVLVQGVDSPAVSGDIITVHYLGSFADGRKFDSSYDRGVPFSIPLGQGRVIQGWDQGLVGVKKGEKLKLTIPPSLGYGENGIPDGRGGYIIPQNATLIFEIEVLKIEKAAQ